MLCALNCPCQRRHFWEDPSGNHENPIHARCVCVASFLLSGAAAFGQADDFQLNPAAGAGTIIVHSKFGGQIFGFDIDQSGTEGVLSESKPQSNGTYLAAVETFDQATGTILKVAVEDANTR